MLLVKLKMALGTEEPVDCVDCVMVTEQASKEEENERK